ncbi:hypothetical protein SUGI_0612650 [Cryptomeria japonica]|uniref:uncharacterized protein LOC131062597 isoform X2 n=1 Tax=Cryptomeria japonica TaxID=3369 RepID=UPI002414C536|nr:uncharacterized protein LOC131062597 isoform X2 [Cryptomeria japonica]GLJ30839.1 hypothetical protein SUGI_0612650 [Cryptomeria japonica]
METQLHGVQKAIEQACGAIQMHIHPAEAEATLLSFRRSPQPYQACQYILEHSQMADARFQAAATIQDAALREWGFLSMDEKSSLRMYCLHYIVAHADASEAYVQVKISSVAAILMKRGWIEFVEVEKEAFFNEVKVAVQGAHGLPAQSAGITFLESLVSEFSPSTASAMGLPTEFHEQCRTNLELVYLQQFYSWTQDAAFSVAQRAAQGIVTEMKVCTAALRLMSQILNWDFKGNTIGGTGGVLIIGKNRTHISSSFLGSEVAAKKSTEQNVVQPGPGWRDLLLFPDRVKWLLEFYATLQPNNSRNGSGLESPLAISCRQLIIQFCCLTGSIFPSDSGQTQEQHLQLVVSGVMSWVNPAHMVVAAIKSGKSESELIDGCRALFSVASLTAPTLFDQLLKGYSSNFSALILLSSLTCEVIKVNMDNHDEEEMWSREALNILLDTWTVFLQPAYLSQRGPLSQLEVNSVVAVFKTIVETELKAAVKMAYDEGDSTEELQASIAARDERLSSYALIARSVPGETIPLLAKLFSERCSWLHQGRSAGTDLTCIMEELHWLLLISGHVLADSDEGETPLVPETIEAQLSDIDPGNHPVLILSRSIIDLAAQSLDSNFREEIFSPRLMEAVVWFLARWVGTYLMPHDVGRGPTSTLGEDGEKKHKTFHGRKAFLSVISDENQGKVLLATLVRIAITTLTSWPGEGNLQEITCFKLLCSLVRRRNICVHLVTLDPWKEFANAFANERTLLSLPTRLQRSLAESLCRSASGMSNSDETNQYVRDLLGPSTRYLIDMSTKNDLNVFAQKPDIIFLVTCLLERLRGAAIATEPRNQKANFEMGVSVMNPLLTFLEVYKNQSLVVYKLLKFMVDWVDGQVAFLEAKETTILFNFCLQLLQIYSVHNIGKVSLSASKNLLSETEAEKYKDLRALLQLLSCLCSKDWVDFSSDSLGDSGNLDVAQAVYLGLHIITPLISLDLLKYPKLCHQYFALLVHMLEVYPEKVAKLAPDAFAQIVGTLDFGLRHQDIEVVRMSLIAINAIALYQYQAICKGQEGLGIHAVSSQNCNGAIKEGVLVHFLRYLMQFLLFEDYSTELVEPSADALLPLIMCDMTFYQSMAQEVMMGQKIAVYQSRLRTAFHQLVHGNNLTSSLDRANRQKFRNNLHHFLLDVRGFLQTI